MPTALAETSRLPSTLAPQIWLPDPEDRFCTVRLPVTSAPWLTENAAPPWINTFPATVALLRPKFPPLTVTFPATRPP